MLTLEEKQQITKELLEVLSKEVQQMVEKFPEDWDGIEIRQYIADKAKAMLCLKLSPLRLKTYRRTVTMKNL